MGTLTFLTDAEPTERVREFAERELGRPVRPEELRRFREQNPVGFLRVLRAAEEATGKLPIAA